MGYQISILFFAIVLFSIQFADAYAYQSSEVLQAKGAVAFLTILGTIITVILFKKNEWFEDKWYFASSYQKMISIGIGVPLWIAIFAILFDGYLVGLLLIIVSCIIITLHVRRWKRRRIGSTYKKSKSYDEDRTYQNQSSSRSSYSNPNERTHYKERSDYNETSGRQEESRKYNEQSDEEYEKEEQYEDDEYEEESETSETPLKKYYDVLEISENATADEIKKAYKRLVRQWHPDTHKSSERKQIAEKEMKKINEAYDMLEKAGKVR